MPSRKLLRDKKKLKRILAAAAALVLLLIILLAASSARKSALRKQQWTKVTVMEPQTGDGSLSASSDTKTGDGSLSASSVETGDGSLSAPSDTQARDGAVSASSDNGGVSSVSGEETENRPLSGDSITILGTGDNLMHRTLYENAWNGETYDFTKYYVPVKDQVQAADIATINQESPMASDLYDLSTYPRFNSPKQLGAAIIDTGFDIVNLANNHTFDMGSAGAAITKKYFDNREIPTVGVYNDYADMLDIRVVEANGIRVAFLSFIEMLNHEPDGSGAEIVWMEDKTMVEQQIAEAKKVSDIIVAHVHWGEELTTDLTPKQEEYAQYLVDAGVDIIFGNHPHWLQELTVLTRASDGTQCPVAYSLGNFVTGMDRREEVVTGFLTVRVSRDPETGKARPDAMEFTPLVLHFTSKAKKDLAIYPLTQYTADMAAAHYVNELRGPFDLDYIQNIIDSTIPTRYQGRMAPIVWHRA